MATVTISNSPLHSDAIITALFGETGQYWQNIHTGTDFAPFGRLSNESPFVFCM